MRVTDRLDRPERLAVLAGTGLVGRRDMPGLDRLARLASRLVDVPTTLVSLVGADGQVFPGRIGMDVASSPLSHSFCRFVVTGDAPLIVPDARLDPRVSDNPAIPDLGVIAYAGMPIRLEGETLGAFCAIDSRPRAWTDAELAVLADLTAAVESEIALDRAGLLAGEFDSYERVTCLLHARGHPVDVRVAVRLVREVDGTPLHLLAIVADITAQLHAQRERDAALDALTDRNRRLEQANLLKLDLMGMLSHDIGTPLATIIGYGEVLAETLTGPRQQAAMDRMLNGARRIDNLRHNVLAMCALDAERLQTRREEVLLATALEEAVRAADLTVPVSCPPGVTVLANPAHLQQIVVNFLTNAAKYAGGATRITVAVAGDGVEIGVHDFGPGVPAVLRAHLFERYTRAVDVTAHGHGIGLHIVASLAEANGGSVAHRDDTPTGSVFTLSLRRPTS